MSCQGTCAYVLPTFSPRWKIAPWAFDPVHLPHCKTPNSRNLQRDDKVEAVIGNDGFGML